MRLNNKKKMEHKCNICPRVQNILVTNLPPPPPRVFFYPSLVGGQRVSWGLFFLWRAAFFMSRRKGTTNSGSAPNSKRPTLLHKTVKNLLSLSSATSLSTILFPIDTTYCSFFLFFVTMSPNHEDCFGVFFSFVINCISFLAFFLRLFWLSRQFPSFVCTVIYVPRYVNFFNLPELMLLTLT